MSKSNMGFAKSSPLYLLRVLLLEEVWPRDPNTEQEHFQFHFGLSFSELLKLLSLDKALARFQKSASLPALPKLSQFLLLQRSAMEQLLLVVSDISIELGPLNATCQGKQACKAACKHLDMSVYISWRNWLPLA